MSSTMTVKATYPLLWHLEHACDDEEQKTAPGLPVTVRLQRQEVLQGFPAHAVTQQQKHICQHTYTPTHAPTHAPTQTHTHTHTHTQASQWLSDCSDTKYSRVSWHTMSHTITHQKHIYQHTLTHTLTHTRTHTQTQRGKEQQANTIEPAHATLRKLFRWDYKARSPVYTHPKGSHTHIKDPVVHVRVQRIMETRKIKIKMVCTKSVWVFIMFKLDTPQTKKKLD